MAKTMHMESSPQWIRKSIAKHPTHKLVQTCNIYTHKNSSLKKHILIKKEAKFKSRDKIMAKNNTNKKSIISTRREASPPLLGPFLDCVAIQGLNSFSSVVVVIVLALLLGLIENLKLWKWLMHQYKLKIKRVRHKPRDGDLKYFGSWIEDLMYGVHEIDDLFIRICVFIGLGFLWGFLAIFRRFNSKNNVEK